MANEPQAVSVGWLDYETKQWSLGLIRREGADRNGIDFVEAIILKNYNWTRFSTVILRAASGPNLTALHSLESNAGHSESESMNFRSSASPGLLATAIDWRRASLAKAGDRISGTQICMGRRPC